MRASYLLSIFLSAITASAAAISNELEERATGIVTRPGTGFVLDGKSFISWVPIPIGLTNSQMAISLLCSAK
jgi:hypothetical protein